MSGRLRDHEDVASSIRSGNTMDSAEAVRANCPTRATTANHYQSIDSATQTDRQNDRKTDRVKDR